MQIYVTGFFFLTCFCFVYNIDANIFSFHLLQFVLDFSLGVKLIRFRRGVIV